MVHFGGKGNKEINESIAPNTTMLLKCLFLQGFYNNLQLTIIDDIKIRNTNLSFALILLVGNSYTVAVWTHIEKHDGHYFHGNRGMKCNNNNIIIIINNKKRSKSKWNSLMEYNWRDNIKTIKQWMANEQL